MPFLAKHLVLFPFLHKERLVNLVLQKKVEIGDRPYRIRTCDTLIKRQRHRHRAPYFHLLGIFLKISTKRLDKINPPFYNKLK
jgi:hypothetical protein